MYKRNSKEIYEYLVESGKLKTKQLKVYKIVREYGPLTANQIYEYYSRSFKYKPASPSMYPLLRILFHKGMIYEKDHIECPISTNKTILWEATDRRTPLSLAKKTVSEQLNKVRSKIKKLQEKEFALINKQQEGLDFE